MNLQRFRSARIRHSFYAVTSGCLVVLAFVPWLCTPGVPDFRHDWMSPIVRNAITGYSARAMSPWRVDGFGSPSAFLETSPALIAFELIYRAFTLEMGPKVFVVLVVMLLGVSTYVLGRALRLPVEASIVAALLVVGSPFVFNEIVAGHQFTLVGLALLPLVMVAALRANARSRSAACWLAVTIGISSLQIQYVIFDLVAVLVLAVAARRLPTRELLFGTLAGIILVVPLFISVNSGQDSIIYSRANIAWEVDQSVPFLRGLVGSGYFTGYDVGTRFSAPMPLLGDVVAVAALLAAVFVPRARIWAAAWLILTGLAAGFNGPFSVLERWGFSHVASLSAFRELYNFIGLAQLCEAIAATWLLAFFTKRAGFFALIGAACAVRLVLLCALPERVPGYLVPSSLSAVIKPMLADKSDARIAWLPIWLPVRPEPSKEAGNDPYVYPIENHVAVNTDFTGMAAASVGWVFAGRRDAGILKRLGIGYVGIRPRLHESLVGYAGMTPPSPRSDLSRWLVTHGFQHLDTSADLILLHRLETRSLVDLGNFGTLRGLSTASTPSAVTPPCAGASVAAPPWPVVSADPRVGWIPAIYWSWYAPNLTDGQRAIFTLSTTPLALRANYALVGSIQGAAHWAWRPILGGVVRGPAIVAAVADGQCRHISSPSIAVSRDAISLAVDSPNPIARRFAIPATTRSVIVYRVSFDRRWRLRVDGEAVTAHRVVDGFQNAWIIGPSRHVRQAEIDFVGAAQAGLLTRAVRLAYMALFVTGGALTVAPWIRSRRASVSPSTAIPRTS